MIILAAALWRGAAGGVLIAGDEPVAQERAVLEFCNADLVLRWAEAVLGL